MSTQQRPPARRGPSGAWSRLKAPPTDPLQTYGLPSKGETRLNDFKAQEMFYNKIVERYMKFCASSGSDLEKQFGALSLADPDHELAKPKLKLDDSQNLAKGSLMLNMETAKPGEEPSPELSLIIMAMRKLRESVIATRRRDIFAQRCYIFIIRVAILVSAWEAYLPALTYLLNDIHPNTPLNASELNEFVIFQIMDFACRLSDFHTAYLIKSAYGITDRKLQIVLHSLVRDDWTSFWRIRKKVDGYQRAIMGFAENGVRLRTLKCLGKTYFTAEKSFIEKMAESNWQELVKSGIGWELQENGVVVIRKVKAK